MMRSVRRTSVTNNQRNSSTTTATLNPISSTTNRLSNCSIGSNANYVRSDSSDPKHISISYASADHELIYETVVLFYSVSAFLLQLLHLYRTVWWLPQSYEQNAMKFYLINPYVIFYVLTLIIPRWMWTCCKTLIQNVFPQLWQKRLKHYCQILLLAAFGLAHFYCVYLIAIEESTEENSFIKVNHTFRIGCLLYPTFIMATTYQEEIKSYLQLVPDSNGSEITSAHSANLQHKCSNDPGIIRQEVEILRLDFNHRLRNVLIHSHTVAVVCTLLPCCFAQTYVHFDIYMAIQHFILVWAGSLTLNAVHAFPPKYCDILHSSAQHLGHWDHVAQSTPGVQYSDWCPRTIWKQGSIIRSDNEFYRAQSDLTSAEPGSVHHERFYALFINAARFQISLLVFQLVLVLLQLVLLFRSTEWYQMISLSLLQASCGYPLFKLMRDAVVVWRLSLAEEMLKNV